MPEVESGDRMTTASIYYQDRGLTPHLVLIDGAAASINVDPHDPAPGYLIRAVDRACRTLGWQTITGAPIVRQADGRGTIRIEPIGITTDHVPDPDDPEYTIGKLRGALRLAQQSRELWKSRAEAAGWTPEGRLSGHREGCSGEGHLTCGAMAQQNRHYGVVYTPCFNPKDHGPHVWWDHKAPEGEGERLSCPGHGVSDPTGAYADMCSQLPSCRDGEHSASCEVSLYRAAQHKSDRGVPPCGHMGCHLLADQGGQPVCAHKSDHDAACLHPSDEVSDAGICARRGTALTVNMRPADPAKPCPHPGVYRGERCPACGQQGPDEPVADWRAHPTIVRVSDEAAADLNAMSTKLGIPADELATAWIQQAAISALYHYNHDTAPGFVAKGNRISRFLTDGSAIIEPET